jgi:hypothetical protein
VARLGVKHQYPVSRARKRATGYESFPLRPPQASGRDADYRARRADVGRVAEAHPPSDVLESFGAGRLPPTARLKCPTLSGHNVGSGNWRGAGRRDPTGRELRVRRPARFDPERPEGQFCRVARINKDRIRCCVDVSAQQLSLSAISLT